MAQHRCLAASGGDLRRIPLEGSRVYIEGRLQTRKWQDQNGNDRYTTEIIAREMKALPRASGGGSGEYGGGQGFGGDPSRSPPPMGDDVPF